MKRLAVAGIIVLMLSVYAAYSAENPASLTREGVELSDKKQYRKAAGKFEKAILLHNLSSSKAYHNMGWVLELQGEFKKAIPYYEEAVRRNPSQFYSHERLGFAYYKAGNYLKAVETGEHVLKVDPKNQGVIEWLPDAYKKKLQLQKEMLLAKQKEDEKKKEQEKLKEKGDQAEKKERRLLYATFDFMLRTGYYFDGNRYKYIARNGLYAPFPEMLYVNVTPIESWEFDLKAGTPHLGALSPDLVIHTETIQAMFHLSKWFLGAGVMGNHYRDDFNFGKKYTLNDFKIGVLFGVSDKKSEIKVSLYPRFMPYDGPQSTGKSLDVAFMEFSYKRTIDKALSYYSRISAWDYYYFNHTDRISNYYGVYEISFGVTLGRFNEITRKKYLTFTLEFTERLYMRNLNNDDPYRFGNGQGFFGLNTDNWFQGDPFTGFYTQGHQLSFKIEELISKNIFLYQTMMIEMAGNRGQHNEFSLIMGVGAIF